MSKSLVISHDELGPLERDSCTCLPHLSVLILVAEFLVNHPYPVLG